MSRLIEKRPISSMFSRINSVINRVATLGIPAHGHLILTDWLQRVWISAMLVSGSPMCAPYRASLFTGKYASSTGMAINELRMNPNHDCFGHVLHRNGYQTSYIGKWHLWAINWGGTTIPKIPISRRDSIDSVSMESGRRTIFIICILMHIITRIRLKKLSFLVMNPMDRPI